MVGIITVLISILIWKGFYDLLFTRPTLRHFHFFALLALSSFIGVPTLVTDQKSRMGVTKGFKLVIFGRVRANRAKYPRISHS